MKTRKASRSFMAAAKRIITERNAKDNSRYRFQFGGEDDTEYTLIHKSCKIYITENSDGDAIIIRGGVGKRHCFLLIFYDSGLMVMNELSNMPGQKCLICTSVADYERTSTIMIEMILQIAANKKATHMEFSDTSEKRCMKNGETFSLANMYFLAYGKTWYESKLPTAVPNKDLSMYRRKVQQTKWSDVVDIMNIRKESIDFEIPSSIDPESEGSAMAVFRYLKDERDCIPFTKHMDGFIAGMGIGSLEGRVWTITL